MEIAFRSVPFGQVTPECPDQCWQYGNLPGNPPVPGDINNLPPHLRGRPAPVPAQVPARVPAQAAQPRRLAPAQCDHYWTERLEDRVCDLCHDRLDRLVWQCTTQRGCGLRVCLACRRENGWAR